MQLRFLANGFLIVGFSFFSMIAAGVEPAATPVEDRAARLTLTQVEALKQEVGELRGMVEVQDHELKQLKKSQQDLFLELERRLAEVQKNPGSAKKAVSSSGNVLIKPSKSSKGTSVIIEPKPVVKSEQETFEAAYNLVKSKQYEEAMQAFDAYLVQFPSGENKAQAHYWLGEVCMAHWQNNKANVAILDKAQATFSALTTAFPTHEKIPDVVLKLGLIESDKGNLEAARAHLTDVRVRFPNTAASRIAETKLQELVAR